MHPYRCAVHTGMPDPMLLCTASLAVPARMEMHTSDTAGHACCQAAPGGMRTVVFYVPVRSVRWPCAGMRFNRM